MFYCLKAGGKADALVSAKGAGAVFGGRPWSREHLQFVYLIGIWKD